MVDSSSSWQTLFPKLKLRQLHSVLTMLSSSGIQTSDYIRTVFEQFNAHFDEAVEFLVRLGWVERQGISLALTPHIEPLVRRLAAEDAFRAQLALSLMDDASPFRRDIGSFLTKFQHSGETLRYRPPMVERLSLSSMRNLLMELRIVEFDSHEDCYVLASQGVELYALALAVSSHKSIAAIDAAVDRDRRVGYEAELAVVTFERNRVGPEWQGEVLHVAEQSPLAGFDIKSVTPSGDIAAGRFIEVKAIGAKSREFYWSKREIALARILRTKYFLYLVPVSSENGPDIAGMEIIQDPAISVLDSPTLWDVEQDVCICKPKTL